MSGLPRSENHPDSGSPSRRSATGDPQICVCDDWQVADDAVFLNMGKVIAHGPVSEVLTNPQLVEIYLGVAT